MVTTNEKLWACISWTLSIVGVIITYLIGTKTRFVKFWVRNSIAFFIVLLVLGLSIAILELIPLIGWFIALILKVFGAITMLIIWLIGIIKIIEGKEWAIPIITDIAHRLPMT